MPEEVDGLLNRIEGLPAGLYLTALSLRGTADRHGFVRRTGRLEPPCDRLPGDRGASAHDPPAHALMLRSCILERLSGPLCDAVLDQQHSAPMLQALSRSNLFLIPLDDESGWYRFYPLFAHLLRVELERREPGLAPALHRRAYAWHRDHGMTGEAIAHAIAGAHAEAAELIEASWVARDTCRYGTVLAWIGRLPEDMHSGDTGLHLVKAWMLSLSARREEADQLIAAAGRLEPEGPGRPGGRWLAGRSGRPVVSGVSPARPTGGSRNRRPWHRQADNGQLARRPSPTARSSQAAGRLDEQRMLAEGAAELVREHGTEKASGVVPLALGASLAARGRPGEAQALIARGAAFLRSRGQPAPRWRWRCSTRDRSCMPSATASARRRRSPRRDPSSDRVPIREC